LNEVSETKSVLGTLVNKSLYYYYYFHQCSVTPFLLNGIHILFTNISLYNSVR